MPYPVIRFPGLRLVALAASACLAAGCATLPGGAVGAKPADVVAAHAAVSPTTPEGAHPPTPTPVHCTGTHACTCGFPNCPGAHASDEMY